MAFAVGAVRRLDDDEAADGLAGIIGEGTRGLQPGAEASNTKICSQWLHKHNHCFIRMLR